MRKVISVSILDSKNKNDFLDNLVNIKNKVIQKMENSSFDIIVHIDIMDGKFVKNTGVDIEYIKEVKKRGLYCDVHLMVERPIEDTYIDMALEYGADNITIHREIKDFERVLKYLNTKQVNVGVSIKPNTSVKSVLEFIDSFNMLLLMSVEPGYGGQGYIQSTSQKLVNFREMLKDKKIQVDGGVNSKVLANIVSDYDVFVIGSYLSKSTSVSELENKLYILNIIENIEKIPKDANVEFNSTILNINKNGYGKDDKLIGIKVPNIRKLTINSYKFVNESILEYFITSNMHEYKQFAVFCVSNIVKKSKDIFEIKMWYDFIKRYIEYINNWDLTDEVGPNVIAIYFSLLNYNMIKKELDYFLNSKSIWSKRIGIVSMLRFARANDTKIVTYVCDKVIYEEYHLYQKATGWVLRELYKVNESFVVNYLKEKNKKRKLPNIMLNYACEKMTKQQKEYIKENFT